MAEFFADIFIAYFDCDKALGGGEGGALSKYFSTFAHYNKSKTKSLFDERLFQNISKAFIVYFIPSL